MEILTLDSLKNPQCNVSLNGEMQMECVSTGNVIKGEAVEFFDPLREFWI